MLLSQYTVLFNKGNKYYCFSTLTKTIVELNQETYNMLSSSNLDIAHGKLLDDSEKQLLYNAHIVCDNQLDEYLFCKSIILSKRFDDTNMHLTIAPTMDCCFSCYYCFERGKKPIYMSIGTADAIVKLIKNQRNLKQLHITWFGGEPLMAIGIIKYLSKNILSSFNGKYSADIITTAYHIDEEIINTLKESLITEMQITIDGNEDTHNSVKFTSNGTNSYQRIINNVLLLCQEYPSLTIGVRVNLTKHNCNEYVDLYNNFKKLFANKNVSIFPGFVVSRNNGIKSDCLFSKNEIALFSLDLWESHKIPTPWIMYQKTQSECAIRKRNSLVVDASGNLYKCWEKIGDLTYKIGNLTQTGDITNINHIQLNRYLYGADILEDSKCRKCAILPICFGGCPLLRIENVYDCKNNNLCSSYKGCISHYLSAYIELKEILHNKTQ